MQEEQYDIVVFAPHLDDAILSTGQHILEWKKQGKKIKIISIFTKHVGGDGLPNYTKEFLATCGFNRAVDFGKERVNEDKKAMKELGIDWEHWNIIDAGFRVDQNKIIYPTKEKLLGGKISLIDKGLIKLIAEKMSKINGKLFMLPFGVGGHVDHLITRKAGEILSNERCYYLDAPYLWENGSYFKYLKMLGKIKSWKLGSKEKDKLLKNYGTQYRLWPKIFCVYPDVLVRI